MISFHLNKKNRYTFLIKPRKQFRVYESNLTCFGLNSRKLILYSVKIRNKFPLFVHINNMIDAKTPYDSKVICSFPTDMQIMHKSLHSVWQHSIRNYYESFCQNVVQQPSILCKPAEPNFELIFFRLCFGAISPSLLYHFKVILLPLFLLNSVVFLYPCPHCPLCNLGF